MPKGQKFTTETCVKAVLEKFPQNKDRYDYSLVDYKNNKTHVDIICLLHGIFQQTPEKHLKGNGCSKCAVEKQTKTHQQFFEDAQKIHFGKYIYLSSYETKKTKMKMLCKDCQNVFLQTPDSHLNGSGCPKCAKEKSILGLKLASKITAKINNKRARIFSDEKTGFYINKAIWNSYKKGALERNLIFEIKPEDIFNLYKKQNGLCVYTGAKLNCDSIVSKKIDWSIDRIDNSKGYTKDNILLVSKTANMFRNRSTIKEMLEFCNMVVSVHNGMDKYSSMSPEEKAEILKSHSIRFNKKKD
jgi:hypothetical protein